MKVLLINNDKGWSGGQEHLKDLAGELIRQGVEVHFVVRGGSRSQGRFAELGAPVHPMPGHGLGDLTALGEMVALLRRERFRIVSVNREHDLLLTALAWRIAFPWRKPGRLMMSYHTATSRRQMLLGSADAIVCISEHVRTRLLKGNPRAASKVHLLYYGINLAGPPEGDKFDPDRKRRFFQGAGFPLVGMVGEFWKNQAELVEMIPEFRKSFPGITLAFVGDESDRNLVDPLRARIRELGAENNVVFTGRVPRDRIPDIFHDFDLSLTTHRNEGFGIVHLESLAAGTPVVAYNEGGFVDIFRGEDAGILVDGGPDAFISAVTGLLTDHERRFAMGKAGYDLVERRYSVRAMAENYLAFYHNLLGT